MNRYTNSTIDQTQQGQPYFKQRFYPNIPLSENDVYVITTVGDRLDSLANSYYNDSTLWWIISIANNNISTHTHKHKRKRTHANQQCRLKIRNTLDQLSLVLV